jgi:predicted TIM-barrel fold metal-dependent hydrolase
MTTTPAADAWMDAEVHLLPPEWCTRDFLPAQEEDILRKLVYTHPDRELALSRATAEATLEEMDRAGIARSVVMGLPWRSAEMNWKNNQYIADVCAAYPDRFIGMGMTPAPDTEDPREAVKRIAGDLGLSGVKVIPSWQGYSLDDAVFAPALEEMCKLGLPLEPHTDQGFLSPETYDSVYSLFTVACRYPELRILAPHLGGLLCLYNLHPPIQEKIKNIVFVGSVPTTMKMIEFAVQTVGADRVAFGSDFPFNPTHDQLSLRRQTESLDLDPEELRQVASGTLSRFFDLT